MKRIAWSSKLNLGVEQIDDQHKRLVKLTNNLIGAIQSNMADDILGFIAQELREYTEFHFQDEERLMRDIGYPDLDDHAALHGALKERVTRYQESLEQGGAVPATEILSFLKDWLVNHIIYCDMKIGKYIREQKEE